MDRVESAIRQHGATVIDGEPDAYLLGSAKTAEEFSAAMRRFGYDVTIEYVVRARKPVRRVFEG